MKKLLGFLALVWVVVFLCYEGFDPSHGWTPIQLAKLERPTVPVQTWDVVETIFQELYEMVRHTPEIVRLDLWQTWQILAPLPLLLALLYVLLWLAMKRIRVSSAPPAIQYRTMPVLKPRPLKRPTV